MDYNYTQLPWYLKLIRHIINDCRRALKFAIVMSIIFIIYVVVTWSGFDELHPVVFLIFFGLYFIPALLYRLGLLYFVFIAWLLVDDPDDFGF